MDLPEEQQAELIHALRDSTRVVYPHPAAAVEVIETHISHVLLAGDFAYKFKKPLDLGFLDYSTLAARKFFCAEELRLNRRLAPHLYLAVTPIYGSSAAPRFLAQEGEEAIEYAVKMRRFDQEAQFDRIAARGMLHDEHIDSLAQVIAAFHRQIESAGADMPYGTASAIEAPMLQNFAQIRALLTEPAEIAELGRIEQWSLREHAKCAELFAARRVAGRVRECHGDLHLGNVAWLAGEDSSDAAPRAVPFDGIEFSANLRWIDVVSEVAFLVMDLHARGLANYADRFLNGWLEQSGDYAGLALLDYYLVYRAMVRAKIARIRAAQSDTGAAERRAALADYAAHLDLARRFGEPRRRALILMHGVSGSGKSVLAMLLAERINAIRIRSDVERKRLHGLAATARSHSGLASDMYSAEATRMTYAELARLALLILQSGRGRPVVVDACFLRAAERNVFRALAGELGVPLLIVTCTAETAELQRRVAQRHAAQLDASEADLAVLERQLTFSEALIEPASAGELRITVDTQQQATAQAVERLASAYAALPA
jgi:aminoglycoside phosphotransferase family enzyme/predicted kinase